jgi:hypothetical protein
MSTGSTTNYSIPYPLSTDPVNVAGDIQSLAEDLDLFFTTPVFINDIKVDGGDITTDANTATVFNTTATTLNVGGAATSVNIGAATGTATIRNSSTVLDGDLQVKGGDITTNQTTFNLINATATTLNIGGAATVLNIGNASGQTNFAGDLNLATGKVFEINNVSVLTSTTLGSTVVNSSLTSVGTISTGTWNATEIAVNKGGTGLTSYTIGDIIYASGSTTLEKLAGVATGNALISGGVGTAPSWGKIGLTTHVSGTLAVANGGTGVTSSIGTGSVVLSASPTFTGTPLAPTASVDTNTTQIATTAFVIGQGYLKSSTASSTYAPISSPTFTGTISSQGSEIIMESATTGSPTDNVLFTVERGTSPNVSLRWNETIDAWEFTNDGTTYQGIGSGSGGGGVDLEAVLMFAGM